MSPVDPVVAVGISDANQDRKHPPFNHSYSIYNPSEWIGGDFGPFPTGK